MVLPRALEPYGVRLHLGLCYFPVVYYLREVFLVELVELQDLAVWERVSVAIDGPLLVVQMYPAIQQCFSMVFYRREIYHPPLRLQMLL